MVFFSLLAEISWNFLCFDLKRALYITNFVVIKQIGLPLRGRPILLITRMITDRIGLHSVLLPLLSVLNTGVSFWTGSLEQGVDICGEWST